jgi:hypothetical protein
MKVIPETQEQYFATEDGKIYSVKSHKFLKPYITNKGYEVVDFSISGKVKTHLVSRLIALTYIEKPDGCNIVNHLDNNRLNNHYKNLEWCTQSHNLKHAAKQGRMSAQSAILTESQVIEIWGLYPRPRPETANRFGVCLGTVRAIYDGKTWRHLYEKYSHYKIGHTEKVVGSRQGGELNATSKLTKDQVLSILRSYNHLSQPTVAKLFSVSRATIGLIRSGHSWCEVTYPYVTPKKWPRGIPTPPNVDTSTWGFS